jgi:putative ATP-dependent endonuclease of OLD family
LAAIGNDSEPFPAAVLWGDDYAIWPIDIEDEVKRCFEPAEWDRVGNDARKTIDPGAAGLKKNPMLIGEILSIAWAEGKRPVILTDLVERLKAFGGEKVTAS